MLNHSGKNQVITEFIKPKPSFDEQIDEDSKQAETWTDPTKQGVTKRCRLSWLTNSALGVAGPQPMSTAVHMEPK
jgi:hypothetical protein